MVTEQDIIPFRFDEGSLELIKNNAKLACIGGKSTFRGAERKETLLEDQMTGQIGQYVGSWYWFGDNRHYLESRVVANAHPFVGDGGSDIIGSNIDFKTARIRTSRPKLQYNLVVDPRELHEEWVYVFILVEMGPPVTAHIMGWARTKMFPSHTEGQNSLFAGKYVIEASKLNPLPPIRWSLC